MKKEQQPPILHFEARDRIDFFIRIPAGTSMPLSFRVPPGFRPEDLELVIEGNCGACGGKLVRCADKRSWRCDRSRWWNRKRHAFLQLKNAEAQP